MLYNTFMKKLFTIFFFVSYIYATDAVENLTSFFLGVKYESNTLVGSKDTQEKLTVKLDGVDCFTFIDYVEAMKGAVTNDEFAQNLIEVRYKKGIVSYENRRHFFSDWLENKNIKDVTCQTGPCIKTIKNLNKKGINEVYLEGIDIVKRKVSYVNPREFDSFSLKQGDYIGIYSNSEGLDVSHVGIALFKDDTWYLRHASSIEKEVIDSELDEYLKDKPGVVVYRSLKSLE